MDDVTKECLAAIAGTSISGKRVARELTNLMRRRGRPDLIISDHGTEFTSNAMLGWMQDLGVSRHFIAPASPCKTASARPSTGACATSFSTRRSSQRDDLLNETIFYDLDHARSALARWVASYNQQRPHSALGYLTPAVFAATFSATCDRLRNPDQLRRPHVAPPALLRQSQQRTPGSAG